MILFLLQTAMDLTFRTMDVVHIVAGTATMLGGIFAFKNSVSKNNDRVEALEKRLLEVENSLDTLEGDLSKKIDLMGKDIQSVDLSIERMKNEILERLLDKK